MALEGGNREDAPQKEKLPGNIEIVETQAGKFRLIYGTHFLSEQPRTDLGSNYGGVVLEGPGTGMTSGKNMVVPQFKAILQECEQMQKPIFFVDPAFFSLGTLSRLVSTTLQTAVGGSLLYKSFSKPKPNESGLNRREFLKKTAQLAGGTYLSSDILLQAIGGFATAAGAKPVGRVATQIAETIHPQSNAYILTYRNLVIAEKMEKIYATYSDDFSEKELAGVFGNAHTGLEDTLKMDHEARMEKIKKMLTWHPFTPDSPEEIARIVRLDFDTEKRQWLITPTYDDELLELASKVRGKKD